MVKRIEMVKGCAHSSYYAHHAKRSRQEARPVERILRQESGYGCCVCGHPIFQFHHIVPYTIDDPHYRPEDMMVLCPNHHDEATQGVMKETAQRNYKTDPYNKAHGYAGGMLTVEQKRCEINIGGSVGMLGEGSLIEVDHEPLLYMTVGEQGTLLVNVSLYDQADNLLATISENEWSTENPSPWDIDFGYRDLTVRSAARSIGLSINARRTPVEVRANLWRKGKHIKLGADGVTWTGGGGISRLSTEGLAIQISTISDNVTLGQQRKMPLRTRDQRVGRNEPCWCGSGKKLKRCHGARVGS